ncbi:MAG: molybdenum cofactor biosynthesis protein MoaE [Candidatus Bathyarchaeia archaeon]
MRHGSVHRKGEISLKEILGEVKGNPSFRGAGCLGIFVGVVRGETSMGEEVDRLRLEAYEERANDELERICLDLMRREGIIDVRIHHLLGEFGVGEDLVYVVVAARHRKELFEALAEAVERYKHEATIFKKEILSSGRGYWVSERKE